MQRVSVIICTRDRPNDLRRAVGSLLAVRDFPFELVVVDQSETDAGKQALLDFEGDSRLRHVYSRSLGKGHALNHGLACATGDVIVCTDDDCEAPPGWLQGAVRALEEHPSAALAFTNVEAAPHDTEGGYVPVFKREHSRLLRSPWALLSGCGLGAGMVFLRTVVMQLGGFDELLGPGSRFPSADDLDIGLRVLLSGHHVYEAAEVSIIHHGFRSLDDGRAHARRDWEGLGATCSKQFVARRARGFLLTSWLFLSLALWSPVGNLIRLRRPRGFSRISGFVAGFLGGLRTPVDRQRLLFVPDASLRSSWIPRE